MKNLDFVVGESEVGSPLLRITEDGYSFGENIVVEREEEYVVVDDRGVVVGRGLFPEVAQLDAIIRINDYLSSDYPYVEEYEVFFFNVDGLTKDIRQNAEKV